MRELAFCLVVLAFAVLTVHAAPAARTDEVPIAVNRIPAPDYWSVGSSRIGSNGRYQMSGIVIPVTALPRFETRGNITVISWSRADGSTRSIMLDGVSANTNEQGPIEGTVLIRFSKPSSSTDPGNPVTNSAKLLIHWPDPEGTCCSCASWYHMSPDWEFRQCASGCDACGCEGCICNPGSCSAIAANSGDSPTLTLTPHYRDYNEVGTPSQSLVITKGAKIDFTDNGHQVSFVGTKLTTRNGANGQPEFVNPSSIDLGGPVTSLTTKLQGDRSFTLVQSPGVAVIINQEASAPAATVTDHAIEFEAMTGAQSQLSAPRMATRCRMCGTYPHSAPDNEKMQCTPGCACDCWICYEWNCDSALAQPVGPQVGMENTGR